MCSVTKASVGQTVERGTNRHATKMYKVSSSNWGRIFLTTKDVTEKMAPMQAPVHVGNTYMLQKKKDTIYHRGFDQNSQQY